MMYGQKRRNPAGGPGFEGAYAGRGMHVQDASAEPLLQRVEAVRSEGKGWRARCPACGGTSRKLSVAVSDGRVLVHCFAGCRGDDVIASVGLRWGDLHPPRYWPQTREERERERRAIREAGIASAVEVLALEAAVIEAAGRELEEWHLFGAEDQRRLSEAVERISSARLVLSRAQPWRPTHE